MNRITFKWHMIIAAMIWVIGVLVYLLGMYFDATGVVL